MLTKARRLQQAYAAVHGYFWVPCPVCREPYGGHEWDDWVDQDGEVWPSSVPDPDQPRISQGICPHCTRAGYGYPYDVADEIWSSCDSE